MLLFFGSFYIAYSLHIQLFQFARALVIEIADGRGADVKFLVGIHFGNAYGRVVDLKGVGD